MLISEQFSDRTISHMDMALERACRALPEAFAYHLSRKFVAEKIVECAKLHTQTLGGLTEAGRRAVAELVMRERALRLAKDNGLPAEAREGAASARPMNQEIRAWG